MSVEDRLKECETAICGLGDYIAMLQARIGALELIADKQEEQWEDERRLATILSIGAVELQIQEQASCQK